MYMCVVLADLVILGLEEEEDPVNLTLTVMLTLMLTVMLKLLADNGYSLGKYNDNVHKG